MKGRVFRALAVVVSALAWATAAPAQPATEITVYHYQSDKRYEALKELFRRFEAENPDIKVRDVFKPDPQMTAEVQAALTARRPLDLATVAGRNVRLMATTTGAVPVDADPAKAGFLSAYLPQFLDVGRVNGRVYAVPFAFGTPLIYYNRDLLRQAGLDPETTSLRTWDEVIAVAKTIQDRTGVPGLGHLTAGNKDAGTMLMVANAGGEYLSPDGTRLLIDSPQGIAALQFWQDLAVRHKVMPIANDSQWLAAFLGGRLGMFMTSSALLRTAVEATKGKFDLGVANYPVFPGRNARRVTNTGAAVMLYAPEGPRREASLKLLAFLSRLENANHWSRESGYMPLLQDPLRDPAMRAYVEEFPYVKPVIAQMPDTISTYVWGEKGALEAQTIVSALIDDLWANKGPAAILVPPAVARANAALAP